MTSFLQPARGPLVARGRLLHRTRAMAFVEGSVFDAQGNLCCHASGTFKLVPAAQAGAPWRPTEAFLGYQKPSSPCQSSW